MEAKLVPYLNFNGSASDALDFYQQVFGGELTKITFGEFKMVEPDSPIAGLIMHGNLVGGLVHLCGSDAPEEPGKAPISRGNDVTLAWMGEDDETLRRIFNELAESGEVQVALAKQDWGDTFGEVIDRFGVRWMVDIFDAPEA